MARDLSVIHPELQPLAKSFPRISFNRWNIWLVRRLARFQPKPKLPDDVHIEHTLIPTQDAKHTLRLRLYRPANRSVPSPVLLWMHGGGLIMGSPELDDSFIPRFARETGILIVSVDYRLAPAHPFPTPLEDCYTALQWIQANAASLGIDPARIAIGGESAGGGLAASLAQLAHDRGEVQPIFQMLVYPMIDDTSAIRANVPHTEWMTWDQKSNRFGWESYLRQPCGSAQTPPYAVASRRDDLTGLPPAWIGVGTIDLFYEEDMAYAEKLKRCGVDCELLVVPGALHGFDLLAPQLQIVQAFRESQIAALRKYLLPG